MTQGAAMTAPVLSERECDAIADSLAEYHGLREYRPAFARDLIRAGAAARVPPREATPEMCAAVSNVVSSYAASKIWRQMLDAAPRGTTQSGEAASAHPDEKADTRGTEPSAPPSTFPDPQAASPVAWCEKDGDEWICYDADSNTGKHVAAHQKIRHGVDIFPLYAAPQEAVAWMYTSKDNPALRDVYLRVQTGLDKYWYVTPLYAAAPQDAREALIALIAAIDDFSEYLLKCHATLITEELARATQDARAAIDASRGTP